MTLLPPGSRRPKPSPSEHESDQADEHQGEALRLWNRLMLLDRQGDIRRVRCGECRELRKQENRPGAVAGRRRGHAGAQNTAHGLFSGTAQFLQGLIETFDPILQVS